jgi:N-acyl homoserine lactone hydrolase
MVDATIEGIHRGTLVSDRNFHVEAETTATAGDPSPTVSRRETPVYSFVIDHPEGTVLVDTGSHPEAGRGHWPDRLYDTFEHVDAADHPLAADLERAGYAVDDVDYVLQTHLHVDHAGGLHNFAGTDTPVFVHEEELKFAYYSAATDEGSTGYVQADFDHDLNWRVVRRDRVQFFEDVEFLRLPGHSPGLLGLVVHLDGYGTLVFTSDVVEVAANYEREHPPGPGLLRDRPRWQDSIRTLKDLERRHDAELVYGHDPDQVETVLDGWP